MKIRNGFVSNSSSSSFVIRGVTVKLETLGVESEDELYKLISQKRSKIKYESNRYYFGGEQTGEIILGYDVLNPDDGTVSEISDSKLVEKDALIKEELAKFGIEVKELSTFFQYVSNDNY